ncbi:hypothetical protein SNEBB_010038, partial [Seison nebaliae]
MNFKTEKSNNLKAQSIAQIFQAMDKIIKDKRIKRKKCPVCKKLRVGNALELCPTISKKSCGVKDFKSEKDSWLVRYNELLTRGPLTKKVELKKFKKLDDHSSLIQSDKPKYIPNRQIVDNISPDRNYDKVKSITNSHMSSSNGRKSQIILRTVLCFIILLVIISNDILLLSGTTIFAIWFMFIWNPKPISNEKCSILSNANSPDKFNNLETKSQTKTTKFKVNREKLNSSPINTKYHISNIYGNNQNEKIYSPNTNVSTPIQIRRTYPKGNISQLFSTEETSSSLTSQSDIYPKCQKKLIHYEDIIPRLVYKYRQIEEPSTCQRNNNLIDSKLTSTNSVQNRKTMKSSKFYDQSRFQLGYTENNDSFNQNQNNYFYDHSQLFPHSEVTTNYQNEENDKNKTLKPFRENIKYSNTNTIDYSYTEDNTGNDIATDLQNSHKTDFHTVSPDYLSIDTRTYKSCGLISSYNNCDNYEDFQIDYKNDSNSTENIISNIVPSNKYEDSINRTKNLSFIVPTSEIYVKLKHCGSLYHQSESQDRTNQLNNSGVSSLINFGGNMKICKNESDSHSNLVTNYNMLIDTETTSNSITYNCCGRKRLSETEDEILPSKIRRIDDHQNYRFFDFENNPSISLQDI